MPDADGKVQVVIKSKTLWCTQKAMAQLFGVGVPAISKHLKNIFDEGELVADSVISKMEPTAADDINYTTLYYSLDAIISRLSRFFAESHSFPPMDNENTQWVYQDRLYNGRWTFEAR